MSWMRVVYGEVSHPVMSELLLTSTSWRLWRLAHSLLDAGAPTVNKKFGTKVAVLVGDFLFAQSSWFLAQLDNLEVSLHTMFVLLPLFLLVQQSLLQYSQCM